MGIFEALICLHTITLIILSYSVEAGKLKLYNFTHDMKKSHSQSYNNPMHSTERYSGPRARGVSTLHAFV